MTLLLQCEFTGHVSQRLLVELKNFPALQMQDDLPTESSSDVEWSGHNSHCKFEFTYEPEEHAEHPKCGLDSVLAKYPELQTQVIAFEEDDTEFKGHGSQ